MSERRTFLVFGATGRTGRHLVRLILREGHRARVLARDPAKLTSTGPDLEVHAGSVTEDLDLDGLLHGVDFVISLLGDAAQQRSMKVNTAFVRELVPAMRRQGVARFLYQAGGLSAPPGRRLPPTLQMMRTAGTSVYGGQHKDNEAVMQYLTDEAGDIEWMVHRAGIGSDGPSRGILERSSGYSVATFQDCAEYDYRIVMDPTAIHTCDTSRYRPEPRGLAPSRA